MKYVAVLFISALLTLTTNAAETVVQGKIEGFNGKTIRAALVGNYITNNRKYLAEVKIQENQYRLSFDIQETRQLILKIEDKESSIFAEAGAIYNINLSYDEEKNRGRAYDKQLDLHFAYPKATELNQIIKKFNRAYQDFMADNYRRFVTLQAKSAVEKFIEEQNQIDLYQKNDYAQNYVRYALANLEQIIRRPKKQLVEEYLKGQKILYLQKEYMNFFMQLYQKKFEDLSISKSGTEVLKAIILDEDLDKSLKIIKENENFESDALAELYLIYGLYDVFHEEIINKKNNLKMLEQLSKNASSKENKALARQVIKKLKSYAKGQMAPDFELKNEDGIVKRLEDFRGKPIYLNFWADWSIPSLKQLKVLEKLEEKYGDDIYFISINLDENKSKMEDLLAKHHYNWTFLHYGNDYEIREKYNVRTVPTYFLIDAKGKIIQGNAADPRAIERTLYDLSK